METLQSRLEAIVEERLADWPSQWEGYHWPGYTREHTLRVRKLALTLADEEGADREVVELAALLHDIEKRRGNEHAWAGAIEARRILDAHDLPEATIRRVVHAIDTHAGGNTSEHPIENLVLGDADLIDANFGIVGTWRFITIRAGHGATVEETVEGFEGWLPRKDELLGLLNTDAGRSVAERRRERMHAFCADVNSALRNGHGDDALIALVEHINAAHQRGSMFEQIPQLREIARGAGSDAALSAVEALEAEAVGAA